MVDCFSVLASNNSSYCHPADGILDSTSLIICPTSLAEVTWWQRKWGQARSYYMKLYQYHHHWHSATLVAVTKFRTTTINSEDFLWFFTKVSTSKSYLPCMSGGYFFTEFDPHASTYHKYGPSQSPQNQWKWIPLDLFQDWGTGMYELYLL